MQCICTVRPCAISENKLIFLYYATVYYVSMSCTVPVHVHINVIAFFTVYAVETYKSS